MKMSVVVIVASLSLVPYFYFSSFYVYFPPFLLMFFCCFLSREGPKQWSRLRIGVISCLGLFLCSSLFCSSLEMGALFNMKYSRRPELSFEGWVFFVGDWYFRRVRGLRKCLARKR